MGVFHSATNILNPDNVKHIKQIGELTEGSFTIGVEDVSGEKSDLDYNDLVFSANIGQNNALFSCGIQPQDNLIDNDEDP